MQQELDFQQNTLEKFTAWASAKQNQQRNITIINMKSYSSTKLFRSNDDMSETSQEEQKRDVRSPNQSSEELVSDTEQTAEFRYESFVD